MKRRDFLKRMAMSGMSVCGISALSELFVPFAEAVDISGFSFAHITDLHLDVRGNSTWQHREKSVPLFIDALRQIAGLPKLDFIVFGGDQIQRGPNDSASLKVFKRWVRHLNVPYYVLLGNAEVSPLAGVSHLGRQEYLKAWRRRGLRPGRSSWAFNPVPGVRFIGFDVTVDGKPYGEVDVTRLRWIEKELSSNRRKKLVIVATHQLLQPTTPADLRPEWSLWMVKNHEEVRRRLERYPNVRLVLSGHHHASHIETVKRITYVSDPALVTYPCAFRVITVSRTGIHLKNIQVSDRTTVVEARELLRADPYARIYDFNDPHNVIAYSRGLREKDREAIIPL